MYNRESDEKYIFNFIHFPDKSKKVAKVRLAAFLTIVFLDDLVR